MASNTALTLEDKQLESYSDTGRETSMEVTLSATAGQVTVITLPTTAKGFKLYPRTNDIRFSVGYTDAARPPAAVAAASTTPIVAQSAFAAGGIAKADMWEKRLLTSKEGRTLNLRSITSSVVVDIELF